MWVTFEAPRIAEGRVGPHWVGSPCPATSARYDGVQHYPFDIIEREPHMAGAVRQPIDIDALSRYIGTSVTEIKLPIAIQQVWLHATHTN